MSAELLEVNQTDAGLWRKLTPSDWQTITARAAAGYSPEQIAADLGLARSVVENYLCRLIW